MEDGGASVLAHPVCESPGSREHRPGVFTGRGFVPEVDPAGQRPRHPSLRRRNADPEAVVLADEEQRHGQVLVRCVARRVQRGLRGRVIQRRVTEAADDDRVGRPGALDAELAGPIDRDRDPDRPGQMGCDRGCLRDDGQVVVTEDLVPSAGDRLVDRSRDPLHDVGHAVAADLSGAGEVERARSGSGGAQDPWGGGQVRRPRCSRVPPSRSCRSFGPPSAATGRRSRSCGSRSARSRPPRAQSLRMGSARPTARARRDPREGAARVGRDRPP